MFSHDRKSLLYFLAFKVLYRLAPTNLSNHHFSASQPGHGFVASQSTQSPDFHLHNFLHKAQGSEAESFSLSSLPWWREWGQRHVPLFLCSFLRPSFLYLTWICFMANFAFFFVLSTSPSQTLLSPYPRLKQSPLLPKGTLFICFLDLVNW